MNKTQNKFNFKAFLTLLTALVLSLVMCFAVACGNSSSESTSASESESTSESESVKDSQTISNGNFEFNIPDSATYPYYSSSNIKWTKTSVGTTKGGVVDTTKEDYKEGAREGATGKDGEDGTKVLMLKNETNSDGEGAAQYFTSSTTVTAEYGKDYLLTVWVKTKDIKSRYAGGSVKTGAYIQVKNTVGSSVDPTIIDNIDTNGEWKQFSIYLRPSNYATTKYQVVIGLGHGSSDNKLRACEGVAYFDDVKMDAIDNEKETKFDDVTEATELNLKKGDSLTVDAADVKNNTLKVDFTKAAEDTKITEGAKGKSNEFNLNDKEDKFGNASIDENGNITIDFSKDSAREYGSSYTYTTKEFDLSKYVDNDEDDDTEYKGIMISFIANVTAKSYSKNASVKVLDGGEEGTENGGFDSFATDGKDVRYAIYLTTNRDGMKFSLKITFGPTAESSVNADFPIGKAIFKDFKVVKLTEEEFDVADTSNNGTKVTLLGDYNNDVKDDDDTDSEDNDSYDITTNAVMENKDGTPKEIGLDQIVGGGYNQNGGAASLVNSKYVYEGKDALNNALASLKADYLAGKPNGNKNVQAIALEGGHIYMNPVTVAANSVYKFSVKIRVISGDAFVRLYDYNTDSIDGKAAVAVLTVNDKDYHQMSTTVTEKAKKGLDGYTEITFIVRTGDKAKTLSLQYGFDGEGFALIGKADKGATYSGASDYDTLVSAYANDAAYYEFDKTAEYTKVVTYYKNEDDAKEGKNPVTEKDSDGKTVNKTTETTDVVVASGTLKDDDTTKAVMFFRFDTIDSVNYAIDTSDSESTSESTSSSESGDSTNNSTASYAWLQIISIIIAAVLLVALIAVIVRMATKNKKSKKAKKAAYYTKGYDKSKRYTASGKASKNDIQAPDATNEAYDYGDGETENKDNNDSNE